MHGLYDRYKKGGSVSRKLAFYVVALRQMSRGEWLALEREVRREIDKLEVELGVGEEVDGEEHNKTAGNFLA